MLRMYIVKVSSRLCSLKSEAITEEEDDDDDESSFLLVIMSEIWV